MKKIYRYVAPLLSVALIITAWFASQREPVHISRRAYKDALLRFSPMSKQGGAPVTSLAGVIDPTNTAFAGGLVCHPAVGATTSMADQNRDALQAAVDYAATHNVKIHVPACTGYPISRVSGQHYSITLEDTSNITFDAYGATFRQYGDATSTAYEMFLIADTEHVKFLGATFSQRDVTNATSDTVAVLIGDSGSTTVDDVAFTDTTFVEGVGGDYVRMDGGSSAVTVTRVEFARHNRFENAVGDAIAIRAGVEQVTIFDAFFKDNAGRDLHCSASSDNAIGKILHQANTHERTSSTTAAAITISGNNGANQNEETKVVDNFIRGGVIEGVNLKKAIIAGNDIEYDVTHGSTAMIEISGLSGDLTIKDNYLKRGPNATAGGVIKFAADSGNEPTIAIIKGNEIDQYSGTAAGIDISTLERADVTQNSIKYHKSTADSGATGFVGIYCSGGSSHPCAGTIKSNLILRDDQDVRSSLDLATKTTHDNSVIEARQPGTYGNTLTIAFVADSVSNTGNLTVAGVATTIHYKAAVTTVANVETLLNLASVLIRVKTTGSASTLQVGDAFTATALSGGAQSGRMLAGVEVLKGSGTTANALTLRNNTVNGARAFYYSDADGASQYPQGVPVVSNNYFLNGTNFLEGGVTTIRVESSPMAEAVSIGALSITKKWSFITTSGTVAYTLADGPAEGAEKCGKIKSAVSTPIGTLTPTHFADGSVHTITWTTSGGGFCLVWDATSTTWRLVSSTSGVTVN
jgi:hypothetical protein